VNGGAPAETPYGGRRLETAVILAAGSGSRMWPYSETRPKGSLPIANAPAVRRLVDALRYAGCRRFVVVVGPDGGRIRQALGALPEVAFVTQQTPRGTADALLSALPLVEGDHFLVAHGDLLVAPENVQALARAYAAEDVPAAALLAELDGEAPRDWICAEASGGALVRVLGHPRSGQYRLCGIYAFNRRAVPYIERNPGILESVPVGGMPPLEAELAASLQLMLDESLEVLAVPATELFVDLDKPWHLLEANRRFLDYAARKLQGDSIDPTAKISDGAEIHGRVIAGKQSVIGPRCVIHGTVWLGDHSTITNGVVLGPNVAVGDHTVLRNYCEIAGYTSIGHRCVVGHGAEMSGVLMDRAYLYHYCEMAGVVGTATDIGAATVCGTLRFDDGATVHRIKGRPEIPPTGANATYIGEFCRTGVNAIIMPGCKIGPYSCVGPGVILYEDLPSRTLVLAKQELVRRPWGPERYGW
jgi:NDP-sugar pyrophosphorylase family protein